LTDLREELGKMISVRVEIFEDTERSPAGTARLWTELPGTLRPFVETTVHPLLIIRRLAGPGQVCWKRCLLGRYIRRAEDVRTEFGQEIAPTWIEAEGVIGSTTINVNVGKYAPAELTNRTATINYANGEVICDFDQRRATITVAGVQRAWIAIDNQRMKARYAKNYAVLMSMFIEFSLNGWGAVRFDEFHRQLDALDWWDALCDSVLRSDVPVHPYDTQRPSALMTKLSELGSTASISTIGPNAPASADDLDAVSGRDSLAAPRQLPGRDDRS
jgi:hypothetical protein